MKFKILFALVYSARAIHIREDPSPVVIAREIKVAEPDKNGGFQPGEGF